MAAKIEEMYDIIKREGFPVALCGGASSVLAAQLSKFDVLLSPDELEGACKMAQSLTPPQVVVASPSSKEDRHLQFSSSLRVSQINGDKSVDNAFTSDSKTMRGRTSQLSSASNSNGIIGEIRSPISQTYSSNETKHKGQPFAGGMKHMMWRPKPQPVSEPAEFSNNSQHLRKS
jgi:hypothetical protein